MVARADSHSGQSIRRASLWVVRPSPQLLSLASNRLRLWRQAASARLQVPAEQGVGRGDIVRPPHPPVVALVFERTNGAGFGLLGQGQTPAQVALSGLGHLATGGQRLQSVLAERLEHPVAGGPVDPAAGHDERLVDQMGDDVDDLPAFDARVRADMFGGLEAPSPGKDRQLVEGDVFGTGEQS